MAAPMRRSNRLLVVVAHESVHGTKRRLEGGQSMSALPLYFRHQLVPLLPGRHRPRCRDTGPCFESWYAQAVVIHNPPPPISLKLKGLLREIWCYRTCSPLPSTACGHILRLDDPGRTLAGVPPIEIACSDHT